MIDCLVIQPIAEAGIELLQKAGLSVHVSSTTSFAELQPLLATSRAVITRNHGLSSREITAAPLLKVIVSHGAGTDAIDKAVAAERQIPVVSTPGANTVAVAELTFALILACARQVTEASSATHSGDFDFRYRQEGFELAGKTLGLVGYGRIGRRVAELARAFGMRVLAVTRHAAGEELDRNDVERVDIDGLCARSDIVSLHGIPDGRVVFDASRIAALKPGAIIVNTARGVLLDEAALISALTRGKLAGAGLDVFTREPLLLDSPLLNCPKLVLTPHIGGSAREALDRTAIQAARQVIHALGKE